MNARRTALAPMSIGSSRATKQTARWSVEQGSAQRGAGARLRDATVEPIKRVASNADPCAPPGSDPRGAADDGGAGAPIYWGCDPSQTQKIAAHDRLRGQIPEKSPGPLFRSPAILFRPSTRPVFGDATAEACNRHADSIRRAWPAAGSHLRTRTQALLRPPHTVLAATRRDGALSNSLRPLRAHWGKVRTRSRSDRAGAHLVVPCNIDILLRVILLKLHPTSPQSHTCLLLR
jgi:hypothetical protein